jgi:hypothetical protein
LCIDQNDQVAGQKMKAGVDFVLPVTPTFNASAREKDYAMVDKQISVGVKAIEHKCLWHE